MTVKVMISLPEEFLDEIDRVAQEEHRTRSELLREAVRRYIETRRGGMVPGKKPHVQKAVSVQDALSRLSPGTGEDSVADVRLWRETR